MAKVRKLTKTDVVRDLPEVIRYFNSTRAAKNLKFKALLLARTPEEEACMKQVKFAINQGSYTDMKGTIVVSLMDNMIGNPLGRVMVIVLGLLYHEVAHILYTDHNDWCKFIDEFAEKFKTKHGINENVAKHFGHFLINSVEDGRIEYCVSKDYAVTKIPLTTVRSWFWNTNEISEKKDELQDNLFCLTTLATTGLMPKGYATAYASEPELYDMWISLKPLINKYVTTYDDMEVAISYLWDIVDILEDWLVELMKRYPDPEELKKALDEISSPTGSHTSGMSKSSGTSSSSSSTKSSEKTIVNGDDSDETGDDSEEESNPIHDEFKSNPLENNDGGLIDNLSTGKEVDFDESMESIVNRAMKEADDFFEDEDFENIVQADFDDKKSSLSEENDNSDLSESEINEINKYYDDIDESKRDGNWGVKLVYHHQQDRIEKTPEKIKINARPLYNAFKKMLNNKNAEVVRDRKSGHLDTHKLYRIVNNDTRLFNKKTIPNDTDFVFYLLIDGSGSMSGDKYVEAYRAAALLEEGLKGLVPLKIAQFDCDSKVHHRVVKEFNENSPNGNYSWTYCNHHGSECCNMDGYNIRIAIKELEKRTERNKVLIVLSDGQPSGYSSYYGHHAELDVKQAVRLGRRNGIKIFNIMFGSKYEREQLKGDFKYMYERGIVSVPPEEIGSELLKIAKKELF